MRQASKTVLALILAAAGCGMVPRPEAGLPHRLTDLSGTWLTTVRYTVAEGTSGGDQVVEQQEWHLRQTGTVLSGYALLEQAVTSGDGRVFVCNRKSTFSSYLRLEVRGQVSADGIRLEEVAVEIAPGDCQPRPRNLMTWRAERQEDELLLASGDDRRTLYRAGPETEKTAFERQVALAFAGVAAEDAPVAADGVQRASPPAADVSGAWEWTQHGQTPNGDEKHEREEWHLEQHGARISGYYDRFVRQVSTDGNAYRCSMSLELQIATRYRVAGEVQGDRVVIFENGYEVLEPSPCDNGLRRLDAYEGRARNDEIQLVWGMQARQVLRRAKPEVPTQRF